MRRFTLLGVVVAGVLAVTGCSAQGETSPTGGGGGLTSVRVAETAGVPSAFLTWGVDQGYFKDQGLDVRVDASAGGAAAIPGIVGGSIDIAGSNVVSVILARSKGLPIKMIAPGTFAAESKDDAWSALLVRNDSDIKQAKDLAGKTIAVNTLQNIGDVTIKSALEQMSVDVSGISFVEMGFPDMLAALEAGHADAVWEIEPFMTTGLKGGNRAVLFPYVQALPGLQIGSFAANEQYIKAHPEVIEAFRKGIEKTVAAVNDNPDALRTKLPELAKIPVESAQAMHFPVWKPEIDVKSLKFVEQHMRSYGILSSSVNIPELLYK